MSDSELKTCGLCGEKDVSVAKEGDECDNCYYGMRLTPKEWKRDMKARGIKVKKTGGCIPTPIGIVCLKPYSVVK
jgi:hypothetical protein